jgi:hypothetical protein
MLENKTYYRDGTETKVYINGTVTYKGENGEALFMASNGRVYFGDTGEFAASTEHGVNYRSNAYPALQTGD